MNSGSAGTGDRITEKCVRRGLHGQIQDFSTRGGGVVASTLRLQKSMGHAPKISRIGP